MIKSSNPFNDPEIKKQILKNEGKLQSSSTFSSSGDDIIEAEEVIEDDDSDKRASISMDIKSMVNSAPKIPNSAKNIILDANAIAKNAKDVKAKEMSMALNNIFTEYNKEYGTDLSINFENMSQTLIDVSNPEKRQILELYVSEVFKSLKPIMLLHLINRLTLALDYVLAPERLLDSNQLSIPDMFLVIEKLQSYIMNLTEILDSTAVVKDSDKILKKLAEENDNEELKSAESKKMIDNFMNLFKQEKGLSGDNKGN